MTDRTLLPVLDAALPTGVVRPFADGLAAHSIELTRHAVTELQINLGKLCNQTCTHCHVEAGPTKTRENMSAKTAERIVELASRANDLSLVDLTGGAPEMNPHFRGLVETFRRQGLRVIDRCNLTILQEPRYEWVAPFLADQHVDVVASLPCYLEDNVDSQRGDGVFQKSLAGLRQLNELGYGQGGSKLTLDLVFNPTGPLLPPDQEKLQADYQHHLWEHYGIRFNRLLTITNLPIKRYATFLAKRGRLPEYMNLLESNFNPAAARSVMCRSLVSIAWNGEIYDCDFNQMIELHPPQLPAQDSQAVTVWDIQSLDAFANRPISVADHCYGCTAGAGSSCGGALT